MAWRERETERDGVWVQGRALRGVVVPPFTLKETKKEREGMSVSQPAEVRGSTIRGQQEGRTYCFS